MNQEHGLEVQEGPITASYDTLVSEKAFLYFERRGVSGDAKAGWLDVARQVLNAEAAAIERLADRLGADFDAAVDTIHDTSGATIVTGLGKSGLIGAKVAATLACTGTPAHFVHAAEALHGDSGRLRQGDVLLGLSNSGATSEVCTFCRIALSRGCPVIALTGDPTSELAELATAVIDVSVVGEADPYDLAPTSSTTAALAMGDALAVALMIRRGFTPDDFHSNHSGGALGQRLSERAVMP